VQACFQVSENGFERELDIFVNVLAIAKHMKMGEECVKEATTEHLKVMPHAHQ
jgi:hypothetical protein